jgi:metallothionein
MTHYAKGTVLTCEHEGCGCRVRIEKECQCPSGAHSYTCACGAPLGHAGWRQQRDSRYRITIAVRRRRFLAISR